MGRGLDYQYPGGSSCRLDSSRQTLARWGWAEWKPACSSDLLCSCQLGLSDLGQKGLKCSDGLSDLGQKGLKFSDLLCNCQLGLSDLGQKGLKCSDLLCSC